MLCHSAGCNGRRACLMFNTYTYIYIVRSNTTRLRFYIFFPIFFLIQCANSHIKLYKECGVLWYSRVCLSFSLFIHILAKLKVRCLLFVCVYYAFCILNSPNEIRVFEQNIFILNKKKRRETWNALTKNDHHSPLTTCYSK